MNYRVATVEDAEELDNLLSKLIQDEKRNYDGTIESTMVKDFYKNMIPRENTIIYLCEDKGVIIGYIYGFIDDKKGKIDALFVEKNYRNRKIASTLLEYIKNWFGDKNINDIEISVFSKNIIARNLYNKYGLLVTVK